MGSRRYTPEEVTASFWRRITKGDDCWPWQGARTVAGYGYHRVDGKAKYAHRTAWELANGTTIPAGMVILHSCDNPRCCRPEHLSSGTLTDNNRDCARKERTSRVARVRGEESHLHKLVRDQVVTIKNDLTKGRSRRDIAHEFQVSVDAINVIATGRTWGWLNADGTEVSKADREAARKERLRAKRKLTDD